MAAATRPLTLGEILDRTVQLYRRNFLLLFGISILPAALYVAISGSFSIYYTAQLPAIQHSPQTSTPAMLMLGLIVILFLFVGVPLLLAVSSVAFSALNFAAIDISRGETATIRSSYARSFRLFWRFMGIISLQALLAAVAPGVAVTILLVVAAILTALASRSGGGGPAIAIFLVLFMFVIVLAAFFLCFWIWIRYCLAFTASVVEDKKPWPSMQRSAQLTKGSRGRIFVMYLMVILLTAVAFYALVLPIDILLKLTMYKSMAALALVTRPPIVLQLVNLVVSCLERALTLPIYAVALLLFYNDQRTRMEGYDIEQLMEQAGWSDLQPLSSPFPPTPYPASPTFVPSAEPSLAAPAPFPLPATDPPTSGDTGL